MGKIFFIIILLTGCLVRSQEIIVDSLKYRADYILSYQSDSTDIYSKQQENFILLIGKNHSLFVSENTFKRDSIRNELVKNQNITGLNLANVPKSAFSYRIMKSTLAKTVTFYDLLFRTAINYEEKVSFNWELTGKKEKLHDMDSGVAYVNYAGRRYKAWYSSGIAMPEGPYKFFGLPGLILKIEDTKGYYKFELTDFKNLTNQKGVIKMESRLLNGTSTTKQQYLSAKENHINNLGAALQQSGITVGNEAIKSVQNRERKKNNPIELIP